MCIIIIIIIQIFGGPLLRIVNFSELFTLIRQVAASRFIAKIGNRLSCMTENELNYFSNQIENWA